MPYQKIGNQRKNRQIFQNLCDELQFQNRKTHWILPKFSVSFLKFSMRIWALCTAVYKTEFFFYFYQKIANSSLKNKAGGTKKTAPPCSCVEASRQRSERPRVIKQRKGGRQKMLAQDKRRGRGRLLHRLRLGSSARHKVERQQVRSLQQMVR